MRGRPVTAVSAPPMPTLDGVGRRSIDTGPVTSVPHEWGAPFSLPEGDFQVYITVLVDGDHGIRCSRRRCCGVTRNVRSTVKWSWLRALGTGSPN